VLTKFTVFPAMLTGGRSLEQWILAFTPLESLETTLLYVTVIPKLLNFITFSFTSLGMRHYYQSPWDFQNDIKHSLRIITFALKPYSSVSFQCYWLTEGERRCRCSEKGGRLSNVNLQAMLFVFGGHWWEWVPVFQSYIYIARFGQSEKFEQCFWL